MTSKGEKSWQIRYRPKGQGQNYETPGPYPAISLAEARQRAHDILAAAKRGIDFPKTEDEQKAAEEIRRREAGKRGRTVAWLLDEYVERYCKTNQRRWKLTERMFATHVQPALGHKPLGDLRRADVVELLDELQNEKGFAAQVNRVRSQLIAAFNWAVEREHLDANPAAAVKKWRIEAARARVLSAREIRAIWRAAEELPDPSRALVKMWMLTGQRRDEVRCMTWEELDLREGVWTVPGARNKGKRDHEVPLSAPATALLERLPRLGPHVFTTGGKKPYAGQKRLKAILDRESGVTGWTLHDLRRTASTGMAALNIQQDVIDRVLNHAPKGIAATYNRHRYLDEKRRALDAWADRIAFVVETEGDAANVIALPRQAG